MGTDLQDPGEADRRDIPTSVLEPSRFRAVFERHVEGVHRYIARRVGVSLGEDLVAETFAIAFRQRRVYDPERASGRAWLLGIATNLVRRHHRDEMRRLVAYQRFASSQRLRPTDHRADRIDDIARLDAALATIGPDLRDVMLLVGGAGLTYEETASALAIPIGTVRSRMWRARRELRAELADLAGPREQDAATAGDGLGRDQR